MIRADVAASLVRPTAFVSVCDELRIPRSTVYAQRRGGDSVPVQNRCPNPLMANSDLPIAIREVPTDPLFMREGYQKVNARLRCRGFHAVVEPVRLLMREHDLHAPRMPRSILGPSTHDGTITTMAPDEMWGAYATATMLLERQQATIFGIYAQYICELLGILAALKAERYEAIVLLHQAFRASFGGVGKAIATGHEWHHDNGSKFIYRAFQAELRFLGMDYSPSFVCAPEGNGCTARFWRTLKELLLWIHCSVNIEDLNQLLQEFRDLYNHQWLIERHNLRPPALVRQDLLGTGAAA